MYKYINTYDKLLESTINMILNELCYINVVPEYDKCKFILTDEELKNYIDTYLLSYPVSRLNDIKNEIKSVLEPTTYEDLCNIGKAKMYKNGWAYYKALDLGFKTPQKHRSKNIQSRRHYVTDEICDELGIDASFFY